MFETVNLGQLYNVSIRPASVFTATAIKSLILSQLFRPPTPVSRSWSNSIVSPLNISQDLKASSRLWETTDSSVYCHCIVSKSLLRAWNIQMKYFPVHRNLLVGVFFLFFYFFVKQSSAPVLDKTFSNCLCPLSTGQKQKNCPQHWCQSSLMSKWLLKET